MLLCQSIEISKDKGKKRMLLYLMNKDKRFKVSETKDLSEGVIERISTLNDVIPIRSINEEVISHCAEMIYQDGFSFVSVVYGKCKIEEIGIDYIILF